MNLEEDCGRLKISRFSGRRPDLRNHFFSAEAPKKSDPPHMSPDLILRTVLHSESLSPNSTTPTTRTTQRSRARNLAPGIVYFTRNVNPKYEFLPRRDSKGIYPFGGDP